MTEKSKSNMSMKFQKQEIEEVISAIDRNRELRVGLETKVFGFRYVEFQVLIIVLDRPFCR